MIDSNDVTGPAEPARFGLPGSAYVPWDIPAGLSDVQVVARPARRRVSVPLVVMIGVLLSAAMVVRLSWPATSEVPLVEAAQTVRWSPREASARVMAQVHLGVAGERHGAMPGEVLLARALVSASAGAIDVVQTDASERAAEAPGTAKAPPIAKLKPTMSRSCASLQKKISYNCHQQVAERVDFAVLHTIEGGRVIRAEFKSKAEVRGKGCVQSLLNGQVTSGWPTSTPPLPSGAPREHTYYVEPIRS